MLASVVFLWNILGVASLAGVLVLVIMTPLNMVFGKKIHEHLHRQMERKDERMKLMGEVLQGIKVVKLYGWERTMESMVGE